LLEKQRALLIEKDTELAGKDTELAGKDTKLAGKDTELAGKDTELAGKDTELADKDTELVDKDTELAVQGDVIKQLEQQNLDWELAYNKLWRERFETRHQLQETLGAGGR
ncbi:MAG: hypothetical protein ACI9HK_005106, partial [Pirellulaceae bacterium]